LLIMSECTGILNENAFADSHFFRAEGDDGEKV
jgi:hypothetical protein